MRPTGGAVLQLERDKPRNRCRKWELRANFGKVDGKYPHKTRRFGGTWREANAALAQWLSELEFEDEMAADPLFSDYLWGWHESRASSGKFAHKTMANEKIRVRKLAASFDGLRISDIDAESIQREYDSWIGSYANSTMAVLNETMSTALRDAVKSGVIAGNPLEHVDVPRVGRIGHRVLSDEKMDELAHALDPGDPRQLAVLLCVTCGLRKAEAVALDWADWDGESVHVERADAGDGTMKMPKTPAGVRSVPVPAWMRPVLDTMRGDGPMCAVEDGTRVTAASVSGWWNYSRSRFGVDCTLHELRHSYLTRLARHGVHPRVMMQLAGHDSMKVCMEIYTHVSDEMQKNAVKAAFS